MIRHRSSKHASARTPYATRTPRSRNLLAQPASHSDVQSARSFQELVCYKKWRVYHVSPLTYFSYEASKLQDYAHILQSYLDIGKKSDAVALVGHQSTYSVVLSVIEGVACSETDSAAIKITISPRARNGNGIFFTGILLSVERERQYDSNRHFSAGSICLPVLLVGGNVAHTSVVINFLEGTFGCVVNPLIFSSCNLMWMLAMWAENQYEDGQKPLMLEYALPYKELHTIQYTLDAKTIKTIWNRIHDPESNVMYDTEVASFIKSLEKHFEVLFKISLAHFPLRSVGTPAASVHSNGSIKILNPDTVRHILRHLTSLAQEIVIR